MKVGTFLHHHESCENIILPHFFESNNKYSAFEKSLVHKINGSLEFSKKKKKLK